MTGTHITYAHVLNGPDKGRAITEEEMRHVLKDDTLGWVHIDGNHPDAEAWIGEHLDYLDPQAVEALVDRASRPRLTRLGDGLMIILRAINFNEGADPEDMISLRIWADAHRIVTVSLRRVRAIERLDARLSLGEGPETTGAFLVTLIEDLTGKIGDFQTDLDAKAEALEEQIIAESGDHLRGEVVNLRLQVIAARRFLGPQRDVIRAIAESDNPVIDAETHREIEEEALKMTRIVEDLDELRDQAMILREELSGQLSDRLNRNMFVMSVVSVIFLPLGFLTGLFGVNVGGMPGVNDGDAFYWLVGWLSLLVGILVFFLWRVRWIRFSRRRR
ncbi:zinc transporter [Maritimibacter alkaliphilus HTCC2654]|uniref:Magnesium transporter, putative n=1 Tax=Maritimibacter alkaliphilus HTCC2654 TaxID=314271 RepID=A3VFN1_9RHOB|nr:zinc transporter ZntB [Maritimibacter alkaliphilus]EAQ13146.1 magnesium transporter, putative [Rhodobacterales bacterium HTCC2654] [Maritimibacter alkaliphilus HTCC2654]TYP83916.1 zinc transporter [Maritimibacter alkaliphilus HTCC2654]